jgi:hypothetical protein
MHTHKAVGTVTTAPVAKDNTEIDRRNKPGAGVPEIKTLNPGDHFDPAELGMSPAEVKALEARKVIAPLEGAGQAQPVRPAVPERGNRTEGSGATQLGTKQDTPPGIDQTKK